MCPRPPGWNRQADADHFREICAFAAEELAVGSVGRGEVVEMGQVAEILDRYVESTNGVRRTARLWIGKFGGS